MPLAGLSTCLETNRGKGESRTSFEATVGRIIKEESIQNSLRTCVNYPTHSTIKGCGQLTGFVEVTLTMSMVQMVYSYGLKLRMGGPVSKIYILNLE